jgi:hypothetical protein
LATTTLLIAAPIGALRTLKVNEETVANWVAKLPLIMDGYEPKDVGFEATVFIKE